MTICLNTTEWFDMLKCMSDCSEKPTGPFFLGRGLETESAVYLRPIKKGRNEHALLIK